MQPPSGTSKKLATLLKVGDTAPVAALVSRARALDALDVQLRQPLPDALRRQCRLANVESGRIVFLASSPAWAAKLRLQQNALLAHARLVSGLPIGKLTVKVAALPPAWTEPPRSKPLSKANAEHLRNAARSIDDPELRSAYLKLASLAE